MAINHLFSVCLSCDHSYRFENLRIDEYPEELVQGIYVRHFIQLASEQYIGTVSANEFTAELAFPGQDDSEILG